MESQHFNKKKNRFFCNHLLNYFQHRRYRGQNYKMVLFWLIFRQAAQLVNFHQASINVVHKPQTTFDIEIRTIRQSTITPLRSGQGHRPFATNVEKKKWEKHKQEEKQEGTKQYKKAEPIRRESTREENTELFSR